MERINGLISIIVPIYNSEKLIHNCVNALLNQTYTHIEIILVDDGSTDNSGLICDSYSKKYSNIKSIHQVHGGVARGRNSGIAAATGEYIGFMDCDDQISMDLFKKLHSAIVAYNCDIAMCGLKRINLDTNTVIDDANDNAISDVKIYSREEFLRKLTEDDDVRSYLWDKLFKATLFDGITFPDGRIYEDMAVMPFLVGKANEVCRIPDQLYYYCLHEGSASDDRDILVWYKHCRQFITAAFERIDFFEKRKYTDLEELAFAKLVPYIYEYIQLSYSLKCGANSKEYKHVLRTKLKDLLHNKYLSQKDKLLLFYYTAPGYIFSSIQKLRSSSSANTDNPNNQDDSAKQALKAKKATKIKRRKRLLKKKPKNKSDKKTNKIFVVVAVICILVLFLIKGCSSSKPEKLNTTQSSEVIPIANSGESTESEQELSTEVPPIEEAPSDTVDLNSAKSVYSHMNIGWSLGNALDSKAEYASKDGNLNQETNWGNPTITKDLIDYVASCGFNTIRIPVTWFCNSYRDTDGHIHIGEQWTSRVKEVVDYCIANDIYVIINTHHDDVLFYAGIENAEFDIALNNTRDIWTEIANSFIDYDNHLIFEGFNEIDNIEDNWQYGEKAAYQVNQLNQLFVDTVRATGGNNTNRILMVQPLLADNGSQSLNAFELPTDTSSDKIIVDVHLYSQLFDESINPIFARLSDFSQRIDVPVLIGEFGTMDSYEIPELRRVHATNFVGRAASYGLKCIWWDNGSEYAIIDRRNFSSSNQDMLSALFAGLEGKTYASTSTSQYKQMESFVYLSPDLSTGGLSNTNWGTLTTGTLQQACPIEGDNRYIQISLNRSGSASDIWLQRIVFYDSNMNYISGNELQDAEYISAIPQSATYYRVSMNSAYRDISYEDFASYINNGNLSINVSFSSASEIE